MEALQNMVFALCEAAGTSGAESPAAAVAAGFLESAAQVEIDPMGNVVGRLGKIGAPNRILLNAHLDQISMMVTEIDADGFLRIAPCGGIDRRVLPGSPVTVLGRETLTGVVCGNVYGAEKLPPLEEMAVDPGMTKEQAELLVSPGDRVVYSGRPQRLLGSRVTSPSLDDRAGCAAVIRAAQLLAGEDLSWEVIVLLSSREETGGPGAGTAAYALDPAQAICVDVSFAVQPGLQKGKYASLGGGPMVGIAPALSAGMRADLTRIAKQEGIPYQLEVMGGSTGTDIDHICIARGGVACAMLSLPQRNMHTPAEIVDLQDLEWTARLMAAYVRGLV